MSKKALTIKLEAGDEGKYSRDSWYGIGPFTASNNDDGSLSVAVPGMPVQVCTKATNDFGDYWTVEIGGGKAFASLVDHATYGKYMRIKLGNNVKLPESVQEKINYKPKAKAPAAKASADLWT